MTVFLEMYLIVLSSFLFSFFGMSAPVGLTAIDLISDLESNLELVGATVLERLKVTDFDF